VLGLRCENTCYSALKTKFYQVRLKQFPLIRLPMDIFGANISFGPEQLKTYKSSLKEMKIIRVYEHLEVLTLSIHYLLVLNCELRL